MFLFTKQCKRFFVGFAFVVLSLVTSQSQAAVLRWNWDSIHFNDIQFPKGFLFGVGSASYQVEGGCTNNQWCVHEGVTKDKNGKLHMPKKCGAACDHWNRYKDDVQLIKKLHAGAYRFSIEWSKVEPKEGVFDAAALQHYADLCDELNKNGIKPVITLYHYTEPLWFARKGSFEKEKNIQYYVRYAHKAFEILKNKAHIWFTFGSPEGQALPSYITGEKPPFKKDKQLAVQVLKNMCEAHVQAYKAIKAMPGGKKARIGIIKTVHQLDPVRGWDVGAMAYSGVGQNLLNGPMFSFFTTGKFKAWIPFVVNVKHSNPDAPKSLDLIGVNYYSHSGVKGFTRCAYPGEKRVGKKDHTIYAEGLYRALQTISKDLATKLNIPIYVTENGIAPLQEKDRDLFLKRYLYALSESVKSGVDVRGYFYWSLMDNYEWGTYEDRYGLYHVDFTTQKRTLKPSAQYFVTVAKRFSWQGLEVNRKI